MITILHQVYDETKRLAIAGSQLSSGDFRLKKLIAPLEKAGKKAPVFAKIAANMQKVIDVKPKESVQALLDLASLVSAVLYTQGQTKIGGDFKHVAPVEVAPQNSKISSKRLRAISEALTQSGSGRLEVIEEAVESGDIFDIRLMQDAVFALDDRYAEIADFVAGKVLPKFGPSVVPLIKDNIDIKGRGGNIRRMRLFNLLAPEQSRGLIKEALRKGLKDMKIACIPFARDEDTEVLHKLATGRNADVKHAALNRLIDFTDEKTDALFIGLISSDLIANAELIARCQSANIRAHVVELLEEATEKIVYKKSHDAETVSHICALLDATKGRNDETIVDGLMALFGKLSNFASIRHREDINDRLASNMWKSQDGRLHDQLVMARNDELTRTGTSFSMSILAGIKRLPPAHFFMLYSPLLEGRRVKIFLSTLLKVKRDDPETFNALDSQWLDFALDVDELEFVQLLADQTNGRVHTYLEGRLRGVYRQWSSEKELFLIFETMQTTKHPALARHWLSAAQKIAHRVSPWRFAHIISTFSQSEVSQIEAELSSLSKQLKKQTQTAISEWRQAHK